VEHRQVEDRRRASGDDPARFLLELRQLRDGAGLGPAELAARAHYPYDRIKAAEVGPTLPDLPVLSAYVRGCGGTTEEWEERWRSLTSAPTLPLNDARPAGNSSAATAGARIGSISPAADTPDPSIIMAALDRVGEEMAVGTATPLPSRAGVSTIEPRPVVQPAAPKSTGGKAATTAGAGTGTATPKVAAWETTTMRTAWSSAGLATPGAGQPTGVAGATTAPAGTAAEGVRTGAADAASIGQPTAAPATSATSAGTESAGTADAVSAARAAGAAGAATAAPGPADRASSATAASAPATAVGRRSRTPRALSRTTIVALIAVAICLLVAILAIVS